MYIIRTVGCYLCMTWFFIFGFAFLCLNFLSVRVSLFLTLVSAFSFHCATLKCCQQVSFPCFQCICRGEVLCESELQIFIVCFNNLGFLLYNPVFPIVKLFHSTNNDLLMTRISKREIGTITIISIQPERCFVITASF